MDYAQQQRNPGKHVSGLLVVVVLHLLLGWALVSGLARKVVEVIKAPIETKIIEEIKPPPPPPPENLPPPPKFAPPPPSFVPPPEVQVNPPPNPAPVITTTQIVPPPAPPVAIAPPPMVTPAVVAAPPAPPRVAVRVAPRVDFVKDCEVPSMPAAAARAEAVGETQIRVHVGADGRPTSTEIIKSSGPSREHKLLDRTADNAIRTTCKFAPGTVDGKPEPSISTVTYVWKMGE